MKIHADKGYHTPFITIKQRDQHSGPNRNPKYNQIETKIHYSFRHVDVLTRIAKVRVVTIYTSICTCYIQGGPKVGGQ